MCPITKRFVCRNPVDILGTSGFNLPPGMQLADFAICVYNEWGNKACIDQNTTAANILPYATVNGTGAMGITAGSEFNLPIVNGSNTFSTPMQDTNWNLCQGITLGAFPYSTEASPVYAQVHDGIAVGQPCFASFAFCFNMAMLPSAFWATTKSYGKFRMKSVTLLITPKKVTPWAAGSTTRVNNVDPVGLEGIGQVPNAISQEPAGGGPQLYSNPAFSRFNTKTWHVHIPSTQWMHAARGIVVGGPQVNMGYEADWYHNYRRWYVFGQTDFKIRRYYPDDLLRAFKGARSTPGNLKVTRHFYEGQYRVLPSFTNTGGSSSIQYSGSDIFTTEQGGGASALVQPLAQPMWGAHKRLQPFDIPAGGIIPAWWAASASQQQGGYWPYPVSLPMAEFVVDTSEWPGAFQARDGTQAQVFNGLDIDGKPILMNPPLEWDVTFIVDVDFYERPAGEQGALLGMA